MSLCNDLMELFDKRVTPRLIEYMRSRGVEAEHSEITALLFGIEKPVLTTILEQNELAEIVPQADVEKGRMEKVLPQAEVEKTEAKVVKKPAKKTKQTTLSNVPTSVVPKVEAEVEIAKEAEPLKEVEIVKEKVVEKEVAVEEAEIVKEVEKTRKGCEHVFSRATKDYKRGEKCGVDVVEGSDFCKSHVKTGKKSTAKVIDKDAITPPVVEGMTAQANDDEKTNLALKEIEDCGFDFHMEKKYEGYLVEEENKFLLKQLPNGSYLVDYIVDPNSKDGKPRLLTAAEKQLAKTKYRFITQIDDEPEIENPNTVAEIKPIQTEVKQEVKPVVDKVAETKIIQEPAKVKDEVVIPPQLLGFVELIGQTDPNFKALSNAEKLLYLNNLTAAMGAKS